MGSNHFRKAREKNVDVTGLTDSCVKKQGGNPQHDADTISKRRLSREEPTGGEASRITVEIS